MCKACGCTDTSGRFKVLGPTKASAETITPTSLHIDVVHRLLMENDELAGHNRDHFADAGVFVVNLMSSPGSGKTSLLEATIRTLGGQLKIGVIEGDLETENDARRIRAAGAVAVQITTGNACHLDANMVHHAFEAIDLNEIDILFIENVGNLVCPAAFDLGQHRNVVLLSVTEGDDKPEKYPVMFRAADLMLITKLDLLDAVGDFDPASAERHLRELANPTEILPLSSRSGVGLDCWIEWLMRESVACRPMHMVGRDGTPPQGHGHSHD